MPTLAIQIWCLFLVVPVALRWALKRWVTHPAIRRQVRIVRLALLALALAATVVLIVGLRPFAAAFAPSYPIPTALLVAVALLPAVRSRASFRERCMSAWFSIIAVVSAGLLLWMTIFNIQYRFGSDCEPTLGEPRNHLIFGPCAPDWSARVRAIVGEKAELLDARQSRAVFVAPDSRFVYTACGLEGTLDRDHPLLRIDRRTGAIDRSYVTSAVFDGGCDPESGRCLVLLSAQHAYLVIDDRSGEIVHEGTLPVGPRFLAIHGATATVGLAEPPVVSRIDLLTGAVTLPTDETHLYLAMASLGGGVGSVGADPSTPDTFFAIEYPNSSLGELLSFSSGPLSLALFGISPLGRGPLGKVGFDPNDVRIAPMARWDAFWAFNLVLSIAPDRARNEVYYVAPMGGTVLAHDYDTLAFRWRLPIKAGIRMADIDRGRGRLFVGDYAGGWLFVVDLDGRRVIDRLYVGRGVRQVRFDPTHERVLVASRAGFVEVDPYQNSAAAPLTPTPP